MNFIPKKWDILRRHKVDLALLNTYPTACKCVCYKIIIVPSLLWWIRSNTPVTKVLVNLTSVCSKYLYDWSQNHREMSLPETHRLAIPPWIAAISELVLPHDRMGRSSEKNAKLMDPGPDRHQRLRCLSHTGCSDHFSSSFIWQDSHIGIDSIIMVCSICQCRGTRAWTLNDLKVQHLTKD